MAAKTLKLYLHPWPVHCVVNGFALICCDNEQNVHVTLLV